ncbi:cupin domain-containing protein [Virgibacillus ihumii]|uniref:cupin domain-containing protein n=1 Tax=Virgibacillus ihumii TaxID=2686091 RepID=UPI00157CEE4D|nr:cupin domain-containing protein [Virgibacillus ihumii]
MYYVPYIPTYPYLTQVYDNERQYENWMANCYEMTQPHLYGYRKYPNLERQPGGQLKDYGNEPYVVNIEEAAEQNRNFRTTLWTGDHLQLTVMSIDVGEDIGLEIHPDVDQFLRIEEGQGIVRMGSSKEDLYFERMVGEDYAIVVPAGKWHNLINTGRRPLKLYTIYAPPEHPFGTVHVTKADAIAAEEE